MTTETESLWGNSCTSHAEDMQNLADLMALVTAGWAAGTLVAALRLGLFEVLHKHPDGLDVEGLAAKLEMAHRPTSQLIAATTALGLTGQRGGRCELTRMSREHLLVGRPGYIGGYALYVQERLYQPWGDLVEVLRSNRPAGWGAEQTTPFLPDDEVLRRFWSGLHPLSLAAGLGMAERASDWGVSPRRVLDVGGGTGGYVIGLCQQNPQVEGTVLELPFVTPITSEYVRGAGLEGRIAVVDGDFLASELPTGHDMVLLANVLHNWDPRVRSMLLGKVWRALPSGGCVVIIEHMLGDDPAGSGPVAALVGLTMLIETPGGQAYPSADHVAAAEAAGFIKLEVHPFPGQAVANCVVIGVKP